MPETLECAACGGLNVHSWRDVDEEAGLRIIGAASCYEWECGHCRAHNVEADAPILAECYTHIPPPPYGWAFAEA